MILLGAIWIVLHFPSRPLLILVSIWIYLNLFEDGFCSSQLRVVQVGWRDFTIFIHPGHSDVGRDPMALNFYFAATDWNYHPSSVACFVGHASEITVVKSPARRGKDLLRQSAFSTAAALALGFSGISTSRQKLSKVCCGLRGSPCLFTFRRQPSLHISYILIPVVDENRYARLNDIFQSLTHVVITLEELTAFGKVPFLSFELHSWSIVPLSSAASMMLTAIEVPFRKICMCKCLESVSTLSGWLLQMQLC